MQKPPASVSLTVFLVALVLGVALASCAGDDSEDEVAESTTTTTVRSAMSTTTTEAPTTTTSLDPLAIGEAAPTPLPIVMYPPDVGDPFSSGTSFDPALLGYEQAGVFHLGNRSIIRPRGRDEADSRWTLGTRVPR